jgi:hypothetical protein
MTPRAYAAAQRLSVDAGATDAERANARQRCAEHEAQHRKPKAGDGLQDWVDRLVDSLKAQNDATIRARRQAQAATKRPWWLLRVSPRAGVRYGRWMGNTREFRTVLRGERDGRCAISPNTWSSYTGDAATLETLNSGAVDWEGLGDREPWTPSKDLRQRIRQSKMGGAA